MAKSYIATFVFICTFCDVLRGSETKAIEIQVLAPLRGKEDGQNGNSSHMVEDGWASDEPAEMNDPPLYLEGWKDQEIIEDYGVIPYKKWNSLSSFSHKPGIKISLTDSMGCVNYLGCQNLLKEIREKQKKKEGHPMDNFFILPVGDILEGLGWNEIYNNELRVNLFTEGKDSNPTNNTLEALAYLVLVSEVTGRADSDFFSLSDELPNSLFNEILPWARKYKLKLNNDRSIARDILKYQQLISRLKWKAALPMREFPAHKEPPKIIEVVDFDSDCATLEECAPFIRDMQRKQMPTHSDIFPNFIIGMDGRIYEGLGWKCSRKENTVIFAISTYKDRGYGPWTHVQLAFALMLFHGVDSGYISANYTINVASDVNETASAKILKWGEWARHNLKKDRTTYVENLGGEDITIAERKVEEERLFSLNYPAGAIHFKLRQGEGPRLADSLPFRKGIGYSPGTYISSKEQIKSNFYFADDGSDDMIVQQGLGWDSTIMRELVTFEFVTRDVNELPSNRSMAASTFLIREGLKKNVFGSDYRVIVDKDASIEFENLVRFWDSRLRRPS